MLRITKIIFACVFALSFLQGCVHKAASSKPEYLTLTKEHEATISRNDFEKISKDLKRGGRVYNGLFSGGSVEVVPYTKPYIYALALEEAYKRNLSDAQTKEYIDSRMEIFGGKKRFFSLIVVAPSYLLVKAEYISGKVIDDARNSFPIHVVMGDQKVTLTSAITYGFPGYVGRNYYLPGPSYTSIGQVNIIGFLIYIENELDFAKPFEMDLDLRYQKEAKNVVLKWQLER